MSQVEQLEIEISALNEKIKTLQHEYDTSRGLWCIDKNPNEVSYEWIKSNCFQLS